MLAHYSVSGQFVFVNNKKFNTYVRRKICFSGNFLYLFIFFGERKFVVVGLCVCIIHTQHIFMQNIRTNLCVLEDEYIYIIFFRRVFLLIVFIEKRKKKIIEDAFFLRERSLSIQYRFTYVINKWKSGKWYSRAVLKKLLFFSLDENVPFKTVGLS